MNETLSGTDVMRYATLRLRGVGGAVTCGVSALHANIGSRPPRELGRHMEASRSSRRESISSELHRYVGER